MLPEAVDVLDLGVLELQTELLGVGERGLDIRGVERPVVDGTGDAGCRLALPSFNGQMPVAQERATVVAVMEQSGEFESELSV